MRRSRAAVYPRNRRKSPRQVAKVSTASQSFRAAVVSVVEVLVVHHQLPKERDVATLPGSSRLPQLVQDQVAQEGMEAVALLLRWE